MSLYNTLRRSRIVTAVAVLLLTLALFIDIYEWIPEKAFDTVLYLQFVPSLLRFFQVFSIIAAGGFIVVLLLTLLTGRLYCSVICPLGIYQDVVNRIARWRSKKKRFFKFKKSLPVWRYSFLGIMVLALVVGAGWLVAWLDPYSLAGRFFGYLIKPVVVGANNLMVNFLRIFNLHPLVYQNLLLPAILPVVITLVITGTIGYFAWKRGRIFCNTICPVGTLLGLTSKVSLFKVHFNSESCTRCGKCAAVCKSECIDIRNYRVDHSRCVTCFNCLVVCPEASLSLTKPKTNFAELKPVSEIKQVKKSGLVSGANRRSFIITGLSLLAASRLFAREETRKTANGKELLLNKKEHPVAPPGSVSIARFNNLCTACSLCVSACPTHVLQPALTEYRLPGFMQPHMDYITSFCNFDCTKCGEVCPTGAILPLTLDEKHVTQMGKAVFVKQNCVVFTDETDCGACSEHCPTKAVNMVPYKDGLLIPEVDQSICIGCGACEHPCPVDAPFKAIYVNGNAVQQIADKPEIGEKPVVDDTEDFPF